MSWLEQALASLPETIDWPEPSPHLAARVTARIEAAPSRAPRRWVWATAVSAVALAVALVPGARQAVADLIVEAGVRIGVIDEAPAVGVDLELGEVVTFDEASDAAGLPLRVPRALGFPSAVFLEGDLVSMTWSGTESLPAAPGTDVAVLLTQGAAGEPRAAKGISPDTSLVAVTVDGEPALWIEGAPHAFTILDGEGNPIEETTRLAANVLLWSADGVDYRLELTGGLEIALSIAESVEEMTRFRLLSTVALAMCMALTATAKGRETATLDGPGIVQPMPPARSAGSLVQTAVLVGFAIAGAVIFLGSSLRRTRLD